MQYRRLGQSELNVSVLSFGAWQIGDAGYWGAADEADADGTVGAALDAGVNLFDTAEMYGKGASEEVLGKVLGKRRGDVYVASKYWVDKLTALDIRAACEASLRRLDTDYLDLYQVHWAPPAALADEAAETLLALRDEGKIRYIGLSNFGPQDIARWFGKGEAISNQVGYNLLFRAIEFDVVPACHERDLGILAYMPLMQGLLAGRYESPEDVPVSRRRTRHFNGEREGTRHGEAGAEELTFSTLRSLRSVADQAGLDMPTMALAWVIAQPWVTSAIVGARKPEQLKRNLAAVDIGLTADVLAAVDDATLELKTRLGRNADMWDGEENKRVN